MTIRLSQTLKRGAFFSASLLLVLQMFAPFTALAATGDASEPISMNGIVPEIHEGSNGGNVTCEQLGYNASSTRNDYNNGSFDDAWPSGITATTDGIFISWSSTFGISAIIVKGGPNANVYTYSPVSMGDSGLASPINANNQRPYGLSNLTFCWKKTETGSVKVNKKVDTDGNGVYEGANGTANNLGFDWGYDDEIPSRDMGTEASGLAVGTHTISENTLPGYVFTGWYFTSDTQKSCANPRGTTLPVTVEVESKKKTEITLCNQFKKGTVTIYKETFPASDKTKFSTTITTDNGVIKGSASKDISTQTPAVYEVGYGTYSITETDIPAGWTNTSNTCNSVLVNEQNPHATCVITNTRHGKIKVTKHTDPAGDTTSFDVTASGTNTIHSDANRDIVDGETETFSVLPGTFNISEAATEGWSISKNTCIEMVVHAGQTVECDIYNTKKARIAIIKSTGYESDDHQFQFTSPWANFGLTSGGQYTASDINAGTYEINEVIEDGWKLSSVWCYEFDWNRWSQIEDGIRLELKAGDDVTCYFHNEKLGSISGFKLSDDNGNGAQDEGENKLPGWTIELYKKCSHPEVSAARTLAIANKNAIAIPEDDCYEQYSQTVTDGNGNYTFKNLERGYYLVCELQQEGWVRTFPADSDCHEIYVSEGEDCIANFANMPEEEGEVLGEVTPTPQVLANTGTSFTQGFLMGMTIIGLAGGATYISRRGQYIISK